MTPAPLCEARIDDSVTLTHIQLLALHCSNVMTILYRFLANKNNVHFCV